MLGIGGVSEKYRGVCGVLLSDTGIYGGSKGGGVAAGVPAAASAVGVGYCSPSRGCA